MNKNGKVKLWMLILIVLFLFLNILKTESAEVSPLAYLSIDQNNFTNDLPLKKISQAPIGSFGGVSINSTQNSLNHTQFQLEPLNLDSYDSIFSNSNESLPSSTIAKSVRINQSVEIQIEISRPYIDSLVLEEFNRRDEVPIMVDVRDTSGIYIVQTDTKEEQHFKDLKKQEFLENKTKFVLSTLSNEEFKLKKILLSGKGFVGNITLVGFEKLANNPSIKFIYVDKPLHLSLDESRPLINGDDVESLGYTGVGQAACVLDSGINYNHTNLGGCFGSGCKVRSGWDYYSDDADPMDEDGHGTNVAGIIASTNSTYRGVAPNAQLIVMRVCDGGCSTSAIRDGLYLCYIDRDIYNISVVSMSIGDNGEYPPNCPTWADNEIDLLYDAGIPIVVASGNEGHLNGISYPACSPNAISVGAVYDENLGREPDDGVWGSANCYDGNAQVDNITCFTNRGNNLDLLAPGCRIDSTNLASNTGFDSMCGTSQAAPHVSGAVILLLSVNKSLTPTEIETTLKNTGKTIGNYKRIDVLAAVNAIRDRDTDAYISNAYSGNDCNDANPTIHPGATEVCDTIDNDCNNITDEGCISDCTESGYEQCASSSYGDCNSSLAINAYDNVNVINWGSINDSYDPYVIGQYNLGWKGRIAKQMYYDANGSSDCSYGGCTGEAVVKTGTKSTVYSPGTAHFEEVLAYNDTATYWCDTWFKPFNPNYGANDPLYVLNCYNNSHCGANYFCNKTGTWQQWGCISKFPNGTTCTESSQCLSSYCDNDGVGLSDDGWCFTPYNTYFDGQETNYCDYASGVGISHCDERQVGEDFVSCTTGGYSYFADQCSPTCGGEDRGDNVCRDSSFASGCTASTFCNSQSLGYNNLSTDECCYGGCATLDCDFYDDVVYSDNNVSESEVTAGTCISACSGTSCCSINSYICDANQADGFYNCQNVTIEAANYFCEYNSSYYVDTTPEKPAEVCNGMDDDCDGIIDEGGNCPPIVSLVSPSNGSVKGNGNINFNCSAFATGTATLNNITLYTDHLGSWQPYQTTVVSGSSASTTFGVSGIADGSIVRWNCLVYDNGTRSGWAPANWTVSVNFSMGGWWNGSWMYYKPLILYETYGQGRVNEPVFIKINTSGILGINCTKEFRLVYNNQQYDFNIINETYSGVNCQDATISFMANATMSSATSYKLFFGNPDAQSLGTKELNPFGTENNFLWGLNFKEGSGTTTANYDTPYNIVFALSSIQWNATDKMFGGYSLTFDGLNSIIFNDSANIANPNSSDESSYSLEFWAKVRSDEGGYVFYAFNSVPSRVQRALMVNTGRIGLNLGGANSFSSTILTYEQWYHFVFSCDNSINKSTLWIDGIEEASRDVNPDNCKMGNSLAFGSHDEAGTYSHSDANDANMTLDMVRFYSSPLNSSNIQFLYHSNPLTYSVGNQVTEYKPNVSFINLGNSTSNGRLNCSFIVTDSNVDDFLTAYYTWYNGTEVYSSGGVSVSNGTQKSVYIDFGIIKIGQTWNCTITPNDGLFNGSVTSDSVFISNSVPLWVTAIANFSANEDFGIIAHEHNLSNMTSDIENDVLSYRVEYYNSSLANCSIYDVYKLNISSVSNAYGSDDCIVSVFDGINRTNDTFLVTVNPINDVPSWLTPISDFIANEDFGISQHVEELDALVSDVDGASTFSYVVESKNSSLADCSIVNSSAKSRNYLRDSSMVMYLQLNNSNTQQLDSSGQGNNGIVGEATFTNNGVVGGAYNFSGISASNITVNSDLDGYERITFGAWLKKSNTQSSFALIAAQGTSYSYGIRVNNDETVSVLITNVLGSATVVTSTSTVNNNEWFFVAGTFNGTRISMYLNGVLEKTGSLLGPVYDLNSVIYIGRSPVTAHFSGTIDEVAIYNRSLSSSEIYSSYNRSVLSLNLTSVPNAYGGDNCIISDSDGTDKANTTFLVNISSINDSPFFVGYNTSSLNRTLVYYNTINVTFAENETVRFAVNVTDVDDTNNWYTWLLDGVVQLISNVFSSWDWITGWFTAGTHNVTVYVNDSYNTSYMSWNVSIDDVVLLPKVSLINPINESVIRSDSTNFTCNVTDPDGNLANVSFFAGQNGAWVYKETKNATGYYNLATFTEATDGYDIFFWNCLAADNSGGLDWYEQNWTVTIVNNEVVCNDFDVCEYQNLSDALRGENSTGNEITLNESDTIYTLDGGYYSLPVVGMTAVRVNKANITIDCNGSELVGVGDGQGIMLNFNLSVVKNCFVQNFWRNLMIDATSHNDVVENNTFADSAEYSVYVDSQNINFTRNTITNSSTNDLAFGGSGSNNRVWLNNFYSKGLTDSGTNNNYCINDEGNFYKSTILNASFGFNDCGLANLTVPDGGENFTTSPINISWKKQSSFKTITYTLQYYPYGSNVNYAKESDPNKVLGYDFNQDYTLEDDASLLLGLDFRESSGNNTYDQSNYGNNGFLGGSCTSPACKPTWTIGGKFTNALNFDGGFNYVNVSENMSSLDGSKELSFEVWIKGNNQSQWAKVLYKQQSYFLDVKDGKYPRAMVRNASGSESIATSSIPINFTEWNHVAVVYNGTTTNQIKLYLNGDLVGTASVPITGNVNDNSNSLVIGATISPNYAFNGTIDSVAIYNRTLGEQEIFEHSRTHIIDRSGNNNNATLFFGANWSLENKEGGMAISLDGINGYINVTTNLGNYFTNEASLIMWVKLSNDLPAAAEQTGFARLGGASSNAHYPWTDGLIYLDIFRTTRIDAIDDGSFDKAQWHQVAITTKPGTNGWKFYQNDQLVTSSEGENTVTIPSTTSLGKSLGNYYLNGTIDQLTIYNRSLTAEEIKERYELKKWGYINQTTNTNYYWDVTGFQKLSKYIVRITPFDNLFNATKDQSTSTFTISL